MGILMKNGVSYSAPYAGYTKTLKEKLFAGETSVTFADKCITNSVTVDWEVSKFGLVPTDKIEGNHSLTFIFPVQTEDVWVKATFSSTSSSPAPIGGNFTDDRYDPANNTENKYVDNNGTISNYNGWSLTDFIDVEEVDTVYVSPSTSWGSGMDSQYCCAYNANKEPTRVRLTINGFAITIPEGTSYIRISETTARINSMKVFVPV